MPSLPVISGQQLSKAMQKIGWKFVRQKGSHMVFKKEGFQFLLTIPDHKEIDRGTLKSILRDSNITVETIIELLD